MNKTSFKTVRNVPKPRKVEFYTQKIDKKENMNKLIFEMETDENYTPTEVDKINNIFHALVSTGGLLGMKNGSTSIHFDKNGDFQAIRLDYTPWRRISKNST